MDVYLCYRFLCLSNPERRSALAAISTATLLVTTAADQKTRTEQLFGPVRVGWRLPHV